MQLHKLDKTTKKRKRIGRGGSRGGTSGKGHKGQRARSGGGVRPGFEGGQMPLYRRLPKRGFTNFPFKKNVKIISLETINKHFVDGDSINRDVLVEKGLINIKKGEKGVFLKILGNGILEKNVTITADAFSQAAQEAIKAKGGKAVLTKEL